MQDGHARGVGADDWLPLGSVVTLRGARHQVMIYGRRQRVQGAVGADASDDATGVAPVDGREWDYVACPWPEGNMGPGHTYLFDADSIDTVWFLGYQNRAEAVIIAPGSSTFAPMPPEVSTCPSEVSTWYSFLVILSMRVPVDTLRNTCLSNVICPQGVPKSTHFY